jgi:hypothetical protein
MERTQEVIPTSTARLAARVLKRPIHPHEQKCLEAVMVLSAGDGQVTPSAVAKRSGLAPIECLIFMELFKAELKGFRDGKEADKHYNYAKKRLEEVERLKE